LTTDLHGFARIKVKGWSRAGQGLVKGLEPFVLSGEGRAIGRSMGGQVKGLGLGLFDRGFTQIYADLRG